MRTWGELAEAVARRGAALRDVARRRRPATAVALFAANYPDYLEALFSIWHAGAVAVPISSRLHPREAADLVDGEPARALLRDAPTSRPGCSDRAPPGRRR